MFPQSPRAISALFVITSTIALTALATGCATAGADFDGDETAEDDGFSNSVGGSTSASTSASSNSGGSTATTTTTGPGSGGGPSLDTSGETCSDATDLTTSAANLGGNYVDSHDDAGSCDPTADNIAWFTYTAAATGLYDFSFTNNSSVPAFSRLAVFEGSACDPLGAEVACDTAAGQSINTLVQLEASTTYTVMFYTDGPGYPMMNPTASISSSSAGPGSICSLAEDLTAATFPHTLNGTFNEDPLALGSCASSPTNVAWFKYTAPTTDRYRIEADNQSSTIAYSRLVVLESEDCSPYGAEIACDTQSSTAIETDVDLVGGQTYLIAFHTDGNSYTMVNPVMNVEVKGPPPPGGACDAALSATGQSFPYSAPGNFEEDPSNVAPTCDTSVTNAAWFTYSPATTGWYDLSLVNNTTDNSYSRVAVFEGAACAPVGPQLYCGTSSSKTHTTNNAILMDAATTYTIVFYTDGDSYAMEDPQLTVTAGAAPPPGGVCELADDVTGASFPYTLTGTFDNDAYLGSSCDATPTNAVWYTFTPTTTQAYTISAVNHTTTAAYSELAVFESNACNPYGTEVTCGDNSDKTISLSGVMLTANVEYLIVFHTDGNTWTMVDPEITITP